ncbi:tetratricopeptide repeat protein [Pedobacter alpinus]|uniref:Tetratricopeptide repeat protein n=1 Tax=Pedobacter alpinus TaxID=1590643 RepID=A0ABW5TN78_9SPHI
MIKKTLFIFILITTTALTSKANFDFNSNCIRAYQAIFDLKLKEAEAIIAREKAQNPKNAIPVLLDNYIDFFSLLASENKADYERLKEKRNARLAYLEKQDRNSPYYLFAQAEVYLQWGLLKSRFQDFMSSGFDVKKADNLLNENLKKFPSFLPNKKSAGLIDVVLGSIPSNMKSIASSFGFSGNANNGIKTLQYLADSLPKTSYSFYNDEVIFFLCYIETDLLHNKANYKKTMAYTNSLGNGSLLKTYLQGYVSYKNAKNDTAIAYLLKRPQSSSFINFPKFNYLLGNAKLNRMDSDANLYLINYLKEYKGINYVKDAYLKLAYYYFLRGDNNRYHAFIKMVKSQGNTIDEKDKQALKEANDTAPDINLLKARLQFDGGYFSKALQTLAGKDAGDFKLKRDQIEVYYRLGRIYDELSKDSDAINNYQKAINSGKLTSYYYAANAALSIGNIYEKRNEKANAANFYRQAIAMKNHEYENSIESKAKEGLKRMGY